MLEQRTVLECTSSPSATSSTPTSHPPPSIIPRPHHPYPYQTNPPMALHTIVDCCCPGRNIRDPRSLSNHPSTTHSTINLVESFTTTDLLVWKLKKDRAPSYRFSRPASSCSPSLVASYSLRFAFCLMFTSSSQSLFRIQNLWVIFSIKIWDKKMPIDRLTKLFWKILTATGLVGDCVSSHCYSIERLFCEGLAES